MLQSIGALKSAIVVLSKHHSSLAQVRVLFGDSGTLARSVFCLLGIANFRHRRKISCKSLNKTQCTSIIVCY